MTTNQTTAERESNNMKALKTNRGWEMADDNGIFESEETSPVFTSKEACEYVIHREAFGKAHDESKSAVSGDNY